MSKSRLTQILEIIEEHGGGQVKLDYLPGSWQVEIQWGELVEAEDGEIQVEGFPNMKYPQWIRGEGETVALAVKDAVQIVP